jgi:DNA-binding transcriptional LysR family regulator
MLNLERLRALHAVADRGSVNAAAQALHVTTSAISQQLTKLEAEIGLSLLERHGRGVRLTDAATMLVAHTSEVLSRLERAEAELDARRTGVGGHLTVAAFATAARGLAPHALRQLLVAHPQLDVVLREQEPHESIPQLMRGDLDLLIAQDWANAPLALPDGLGRAPIVDDVADVALPLDHPLSQREAVALEELAGDRWIAWQPGTICHDWLMHTLRSRGHEPKVSHTASEYATQLALVGAGLGCCVIPRLGRDSVPPGVCIVAVKPALRRHVYALWRTETSRRKAVAAAVAAFQSSANLRTGERASGRGTSKQLVQPRRRAGIQSRRVPASR